MSKATHRDRLLEQALLYTQSLTGKTRDRAIYDFLVGAITALNMEELSTPCPPWLWVLGVRGGSRVKEIQRMLEGREDRE